MVRAAVDPIGIMDEAQGPVSILVARGASNGIPIVMDLAKYMATVASAVRI